MSHLHRHLTVKGYLLRFGLHWVNLLEASLAVKAPRLRGLMSRSESPAPLDPVESFVSLCHAIYMTLSWGWPAVPCAR
jgi:hypothetical protein